MSNEVSEVGGAFRSAMRRLTATVTIITTCVDGRRHGMTATAVTSLCADPPSLLVCVNQASLLHEMLQSADGFCVNVLHRDHIEQSQAFSGRMHGDERFAIGRWASDDLGIPYLADAQANLFCAKSAVIAHGTHSIVIGAVTRVELRDDIAPLLYQNAEYVSASSAGR